MTQLDLDLRGLLQVRLVDPSSGDLAAVSRQLGAPGGPGTATAEPAAGPPDVTIRYVIRHPAREGEHHLVGPVDVVWSERDLALVRRDGPDESWTTIPFECIGRDAGELEILCERGVGPVPHLMATVNLVLLARGVLPLHASAFVADRAGMVAAGWSKSGKTEALLAFMDGGAQIVADEWTYVRPDRTLVGLDTPIRLEPWHLVQQPHLSERIDPRDLRHLNRLRLPARVEPWFRTSAARRLPGRRFVVRGLADLLSHRHVDVEPGRLFGTDRRGDGARLDQIFWMVPGVGQHVTASPIDPSLLVDRMAVAHVHHRRDFVDAYLRFRYAFPERSNPFLDDVERHERDLLAAAVSGATAVRIDHPRPVDLAVLRDVMASAMPSKAMR